MDGEKAYAFLAEHQRSSVGWVASMIGLRAKSRRVFIRFSLTTPKSSCHPTRPLRYYLSRIFIRAPYPRVTSRLIRRRLSQTVLLRRQRPSAEESGRQDSNLQDPA